MAFKGRGSIELATGIAERTLIILKPEVYERQLYTSCMNGILPSGRTWQVIAATKKVGSREMWEKHYARVLSEIAPGEGVDLLNRMTRGECMFLVLQGEGVMKYMTETVKPSLRAAFAEGHNNLIHTSDVDDEIAKAEIDLWFPNL